MKPTTPQAAAGWRTLPPASVPGAWSTMPDATATAEPDDEPPGTRSRSCGLRHVGRPGVWPIIPQAICVIASLPSEIAPAASTRCTIVALVRAGSSPERQGAPPVVCRPATSKQSFQAQTVPASGPGASTARRRVVERAGALERALAVELPEGAEVTERRSARQRLLHPLRDSARDVHGVG